MCTVIIDLVSENTTKKNEQICIFASSAKLTELNFFNLYCAMQRTMLNSMSATKLFATCMDSIVIKIVNTNGPDCDGPIEFWQDFFGFFFSVSFLEISSQFVGERKI